MLSNIANNKSTNIFESITGVLNIAPIKLSGKYKIVIDSNNVLYLDDYNSRRVVIDMSQPFLAQVGNFLSTKTIISNNQYIKYGGFNHGKQKAYHIPVYLNDKNTLPKYFVLNRVQNQTIGNSENLHKNSTICKLVDLHKIGLLNIFNEVLEFEYPLYFNWDNSTIDIFGYSITELSKINKTISISDNQSNQPTIEVLNNQILNSFVKNDIIFPKFLNIEFEFDYDTDKFEFNNFFGFLSNENLIDITEFNENLINVSIKNYIDKFTYKQERIFDKIIVSEPYIDLYATGTINNITNQIPQVRFTIKNIAPEDYFKIIHPDGSIFFEYIVQSSDMRATLKDTLNYVCKRAQSLSGLNFLFTSTKSNNGFIVTIKSNIGDEFVEEYIVDTPNTFKKTDNNQNNFYGILDNDIEIFGNSDSIISTILINNVYYYIIDKYVFNGKTILRLNNDPNISTVSVVDFFETKKSTLHKLSPINYYSVNSSIKSFQQFDKNNYIAELTNLFITNRGDLDNPRIAEFIEASQHAIEVFDKFNDLNDYIQYVNDIIIKAADNSDLTITHEISELVYSYHNNVNILNMMFNSSGNTAYLTPNILNIDKKFYNNNGNLDYILLDADRLKFHWFLIKSKCPEYLKTSENDIRQLRYFTDLPKITSRLISSDINSLYCETIFLGVKYRLPQKYKNYQFAVYLNYNDDMYIERKYSFDVNNINKTIFLVINKYIDFIDLLRGGNFNNEPFIDLSFFYSVQESHNTLSEVIYSFKSGGILLCDDIIPVMFESNLINDWKYYDSVTNKWYICLKRSSTVITAQFTELFPNEGDFEFYVYSKVTIDNVVYDYASMIFKIKNIRLRNSDYVWCEDLFVEFLPTSRLFLNRGNNDFIRIKPENIISILPYNNNVYSNYEAEATILVDSQNTKFKIINPTNELFSIKKYYFEIVKRVIFDELTSIPTTTINIFTFDEYIFPDKTFEGLSTLYDINIDTFDSVTNNQKLTIFDRNQLWKVIKDILKIDVRFKHNTATQTRKLINELLVNNLAEYSNLFSIPISTTNEYIKIDVIQNDTNLVIWKHYPEIGATKPENKVFKINRYSGVYQPTLFKLENELQFQSDILDNRQDVLFNIFDNNFGGKNITATGIWKEVSGNIVSSLFCKTTDIIITVEFSTIINYKKILIDSIIIDDMIINNKNETYIKPINGNIDEYIKDSYVIWLLENFYKLEKITNELNQSIPYNNSESNKYEVLFNQITSFNTRFEKLIFVFTRK